MKANNGRVDEHEEFDADATWDDEDTPETVAERLRAVLAGASGAVADRAREVVRDANWVHGLLAVVLFFSGAQLGAYSVSQKLTGGRNLVRSGQQSVQTEPEIKEQTDARKDSEKPLFVPRKVVLGALFNET